MRPVGEGRLLLGELGLGQPGTPLAVVRWSGRGEQRVPLPLRWQGLGELAQGFHGVVVPRSAVSETSARQPRYDRPRRSGSPPPGQVVKAVVMAGGEGSRLRPLTSRRTKPLVPRVGLPVMEHMLQLLRGHGV